MRLIKFRTILSVLLFLSISIKSYSQGFNSFYFNMNKVVQFEKEEKIDSAIITFENSFKYIGYVHEIYFNKIIDLYKIKRDKQKVLYYKNILLKKKSNVNNKLVFKIDSIYRLDQIVRRKSLNRFQIKKIGEIINDSTIFFRYNKYNKVELSKKILRYIDSTNIETLLNLINEFGYIGENLVGKKCFKTKLILLHYDRDTNNNRLNSILKEALAKGEILPIEYAQIIDRHYQNYTNKQLYWTWFINNNGNPNLSEQEIEQVLKLREDIGIFYSKFWFENIKGHWILKNEFIF